VLPAGLVRAERGRDAVLLPVVIQQVQRANVTIDPPDLLDDGLQQLGGVQAALGEGARQPRQDLRAPGLLAQVGFGLLAPGDILQHADRAVDVALAVDDRRGADQDVARAARRQAHQHFLVGKALAIQRG
jgi:hypothetical protein